MVSLDGRDGHLEGSNGLNRLISTTNDEVRSALSCIKQTEVVEGEISKDRKKVMPFVCFSL